MEIYSIIYFFEIFVDWVSIQNIKKKYYGSDRLYGKVIEILSNVL